MPVPPRAPSPAGRPAWVPLILGLLGLAACGSQSGPESEPSAPPAALAPVVFDSMPLSETLRSARELVSTSAPDGATWLAFTSWAFSPGEPAELRLMRLGTGSEPALASLATGLTLGPPTIAPLGDAKDGVLVAWEARTSDGGRALFCRSAHATAAGALELGPAERIPTGAPRALAPSLAALGGGTTGLAWQALDGLTYRALFATRAADGSWSAPVAVTPKDPSDVWRPRLAAGPAGERLVAYDRFEPGATGGFDVWLAKSAGPGQPFTQTLVAGGPTYQGMPELGVDASGRAWIAYEEAPSFGQGGALRRERHLRLAALDAAGQLMHAILPTALANEQRGDLPRLAVTARGVALTRRVPNFPFAPINPARRSFFTTWETRLVRFDASGAGHDEALPETDGDNENDSTMAAGPGGLTLFVATDKRSKGFSSSLPFNVSLEKLYRVERFGLGELSGFPRLEPGPPAPLPQAWSPPLPQGIPREARNPRALFGDLHRHTDLSRCAANQDGTLLDAIRYARGPGGLDFISITDHFQHMSPWSFQRQLRDIERWDAPGSLVLLPGLEHMLAGQGHQNMIFESRGLLRETDLSAAPETIETAAVIAIPHMSALADNAFPWERWHPDVQRLVEVYQGLRGSYEGLPLDRAAREAEGDRRVEGDRIWPLQANDAKNAAGWVTALPSWIDANEVPPGLIASSDHSSSASAFAGIPIAPGATRQVTADAVFAALSERRAFASTGPVSSSTAVARGPHDARIEIQATDTGASVLTVSAEAAQLASITIFENGKLWPLEAELPEASEASILLVSIRARDEPGRAFALRGAGLLLDSTASGQGFPEWSGPPHGEALEELRFELPTGERSDVELSLVVHPTGEAERALELVRLPATDGEAELSRRFELDTLDAGTARRMWFDKPGRRTYADVTLLGKPEPHPANARGEYQLRRPLAARPSGAIYYARVAWTDGHFAWTRMVRERPE